MSKTRIYLNETLTLQQEICLPTAASNHLLNVLRLGQDDEIILFNGQGGEFQGSIVAVRKKTACVVLNSFIDEQRESPLRVHLGQAMIKGERMDFAIQKAVELGVDSITPLITERSEVRLNQERSEKKIQHWQAVVNSACEQCQRNFVPTVNPPLDLTRWLDQRHEQLRWVCHPAISTQQQVFPDQGIQNAALLIGPEGGLSPQEFSSAQSALFIPHLMGPRVLRAETAALVALTQLHGRYGDM